LEPPRRFPSVQALGRALRPFASPVAAGQWAPALAGGGDGLPDAARASAGRTPVQARPNADASRSAISNTTLGGGAVQAIERGPRLRASLVVGGFALLIGGAAGVYFRLAPALRRTNGGAARPAVDDVVAPTVRDI